MVYRAPRPQIIFKLSLKEVVIPMLTKERKLEAWGQPWSWHICVAERGQCGWETVCKGLTLNAAR